ncbi:MAG: hypothetical protein IKA74_06645 [Clostridia bacterium]|nr:hypothetical protein [Clostridia bacterium]
MIINQRKAHTAYRCPACSAAATGLVASVALQTSMLKLKCPCGKSEMKMTYTNDKDKIRLSIPCLFCGNDHNYVVSREVFFSGDVFMLCCPYTNIDIAFIGNEDKVSAAIEKSDIALNRIFLEAGFDSPEQLRALAEKGKDEEIDNMPDSQVFDIIRFLVADMCEEGSIDCPCHKGSYGFDITDGGIRLFCTECGAEFVFTAGSVAEAERFLDCDSITLKPRE